MGEKRHWRRRDGAHRDRGMTFLRTGQETSIAIRKNGWERRDPGGWTKTAPQDEMSSLKKSSPRHGGRSGPVRLKESVAPGASKEAGSGAVRRSPAPLDREQFARQRGSERAQSFQRFRGTPENPAPRIEALAAETGQAVGTSKKAGDPGAFSRGAKEPPRAETGQAAEASKEAGCPGALLWGAEEASRVETASEVLQAEGEAMGGQDKGGFRRFHQSVSFSPPFSCGWHLEKRWRTGV